MASQIADLLVWQVKDSLLHELPEVIGCVMSRLHEDNELLNSVSAPSTPKVLARKRWDDRLSWPGLKKPSLHLWTEECDDHESMHDE